MLICPICKNDLIKLNNTYKCSQGHSFDISRKGYVNLLMSQSSSSKTHGDDKIMANARREFLDSGCYSKLLDLISKKASNCKSVVDIGCGECYYTMGLYERLADNNPSILGVDISKQIIEVASIRTRNTPVVLAVAGCSRIPVRSDSIDCALSVFAPLSDKELFRILTQDGIVIRVTPAENHLIELKRAVYETAFKNDKLDLSLEGFKIVDEVRLMYEFEVDNCNMLKNLFMMTPYFYKTSKTDFDKLGNYSSMKITADFNITVYKKKDITK